MEDYKNRLISMLQDGSTSEETKKVIEEMFPELARELLEKRVEETISKSLQVSLDTKFITGAEYGESIRWLNEKIRNNRQEKAPMFRKGEYIRNGKEILLIRDVSDDRKTYTTEDAAGKTAQWSVPVIDAVYGKWTISGAKDGEIVSCDGGNTVLIIKDVHDNIIDYHAMLSFDGVSTDSATIRAYEFKPATLEERMCLFSAMSREGCAKNAGTRKLTAWSLEKVTDSFMAESIEKKVTEGLPMLDADCKWIISWSMKVPEDGGKMSDDDAEIATKLAWLFNRIYYGRTEQALCGISVAAKNALFRISEWHKKNGKSCDKCICGYYSYDHKSQCGEVACYMHPTANGDFQVRIPEDEFEETAAMCKQYSTV